MRLGEVGLDEGSWLWAGEVLGKGKIPRTKQLKSSPQQDESRPFQSEKPQPSDTEPVLAGDLVRGVWG